jgi:hypothetical protein
MRVRMFVSSDKPTIRIQLKSLLEIRVNAGQCSNLKGDIEAAENNIILVLVLNSYRI